MTYQVVGPVLKPAILLLDRKLNSAKADPLSVMAAGASGMSMRSTYTTRPRVAEVMVDGDTVHLIRARETVEQLMAPEKMLDEHHR